MPRSRSIAIRSERAHRLDLARQPSNRSLFGIYHGPEGDNFKIVIVTTKPSSFHELPCPRYFGLEAPSGRRHLSNRDASSLMASCRSG
jgi:hypothetical protein